MLQTANAKSVQIKFYTADRLPCFGCQMFKKWPLKLGRMYQTAHQNDGFNALRLNCINSTLPACAMIPNQQNFTRHDERFNFSTIFSGCQIGQVRVTFKSDQAQWFHLEVLSLQSRKSFEYFFCFHRTLGISPKDWAGRIQSWYCLYLHGARLLAGDFATNFDFCNAKFHWFVRYQMRVLIG